MISLKRQQAELYGYEGHPYDALLDDYEKGATVALLDPLFAQVRAELPQLLQGIGARPQVADDFFRRHFGKEGQWQFSLEVLRAIGYDFEAGRQDYSEHPFTTSFAPGDVRITTRVDENDFASMLWSSIHEGGHALYEQGLPEDEYAMPLGAPASLSIHESQSRLWENCVGRSLPFWKHFYPHLQSRFAEQLGDVSLESFYRGMNKVEASLIRTEADELSYHFHVMIRYELEKALLESSLSVADLRDAWNAKYEQHLGLRPPDDVRGILQDVHWSHGSFGYFPTYSLGSFYAAQFWQQAQQDMPGLTADVEAGQFAILKGWLHEKVYRHGRRYRSEELCKRITGRGLDFNAFLVYARRKYSVIYEIADL
jgi:carboxypeptidase Taq